ncbi:hypothetical protein [Methylorubrum aminovorans]|uniref:hypothetical protein n=1 Tax=Methylorubrum aminovorans TaxID=269069 RepID=UPI0024E1123B|nr:hypothetical protein [Methylorubrum aminovorans]
MTGDRTTPEERTTETGPDAAASEPAERGVLTRHWDSLDGEAAALLGAVERDLDRVPEGGSCVRRPSAGRARGPGSAVRASPPPPPSGRSAGSPPCWSRRR